LQQLQLLAASCSFLQPVAANYSESHRFVAGLREFHAFQASTSCAVIPGQTIKPVAISCSKLQRLAASCSKLQPVDSTLNLPAFLNNIPT
jgi:hypothetical protein